MLYTIKCVIGESNFSKLNNQQKFCCFSVWMERVTYNFNTRLKQINEIAWGSQPYTSIICCLVSELKYY